MRIQAKLFLLLVVIAVLPLTALSWRSQVATEQLGMAISDRGRMAVASQVDAQPRQAVDLGNTILFQEQHLIELTLRLQAREVERRLQEPASRDPGPIYFSSNFEDRSQWPPGTILSEEHRQQAGTEETVGSPVNYEDQSFFLPPDIERDAVAPSLLRMSSMTSAYQDLEQEIEELIFWQCTALEDGTHSVFPGHGVIPKHMIQENAHGIGWLKPQTILFGHLL